MTVRILAACAVVLFAACSSPEPEPTSFRPQVGYWRLAMETGETPIPVNVHIDTTGTLTILNGAEEVSTNDLMVYGDTTELRISAYPSYLRYTTTSATSISGRWIDSARSNYALPFSGTYQGKTASDYPALQAGSDAYRVTFEPGTDDAFQAQGLFTPGNGQCAGTFLTETGDYRYLQGSRTEAHMVLSCFDGAHLFFFEADVARDSLQNGVFLSGKHYQSTWEAVRDNAFTLTDPDSLTYLTNQDAFTFQALDASGDIAAFDADAFAGKLTIVQIFGSWCPNCLDESTYYQDLHARYADRGLDIVPVAFERGEDFAQNVQHIQRQFDQLGITYPFYIGGTASKSEASRVFSQLNRVISFPTSVFISPEGGVLKIHTGFYGPGTGQAYTDYVAETEAFIEAHLPGPQP
ncbi:MAG: TlpA disulfide reductase family protein [Flavobacteriales bacterium]